MSNPLPGISQREVLQALEADSIPRLQEACEDHGWLVQPEAIELVEPLLRGNAKETFRLEEKTRTLSKAPWA